MYFVANKWAGLIRFSPCREKGKRGYFIKYIITIPETLAISGFRDYGCKIKKGLMKNYQFMERISGGCRSSCKKT